MVGETSGEPIDDTAYFLCHMRGANIGNKPRACPGKVDPLFRQGHASQVFELARILFDQVMLPDRKARQRLRDEGQMRAFQIAALLLAGTSLVSSSSRAETLFEASPWLERPATYSASAGICGPNLYNRYDPANACCCYERSTGYTVRNGFFGVTLDCYQLCWLWRQTP
jgi:hypothetical protein